MTQITSVSISQETKAPDGADPLRLTSFTQNIHIPFQPDLIKVSNVYYESYDGDNTVHKITSDLVGGIDNVLFQIVDGIQINEPMVFTNDRTVSGSYTFDIDNLGLKEGIFMMTITFIKN